MAAVNESGYLQRVLEARFHRETFPHVKKSFRELVLHFLIVLDQPDQNILNWIKICSEKYAFYLDQPDDALQINDGQTSVLCLKPTYLTPLCLAILKGRVSVVRVLCEFDHVQLDRNKDSGVHPLQLAIATKKTEVIEVVRDAITKKVGKVTFPFFTSMMNDGPRRGPVPVVLFLDRFGGIQRLTQEEFRLYSGGMSFHSGVIACVDSFIQHCQICPQKQTPLSLWAEKEYRSFLKTRPDKNPDLLLCQEKGVDLSVRAGQAFKKGDFITLHSAELPAPNSPEPRFANWGNLVIDGFPNAVQIDMAKEGLFIPCLFAAQEIRPREELFINYSFLHPVKWSPRIEKAKHQMLEAFPDTASLLKLWNCLKGGGEMFEFQCDLTRFNYVFHTPSLLVSLLIRGHFDLEAVAALFEEPRFLELIGFDKIPYAKHVYMTGFEILKTFKKQSTSQMREHFADCFEKNFKSSFLALQVTQVQSHIYDNAASWQSDFDRIAAGAEAIYAILENRVPPVSAKNDFAVLSEKERRDIIDSAFQESKLFFSNDPTTFPLHIQKMRKVIHDFFIG
jgi:hypothetical protein